MIPVMPEQIEERSWGQLGDDLHSFAAELYPICRSITGEGIRRTLAKISEIIPLMVSEVPTGTAVFDWTVPKEWNIRDAYIKDESGRRIVDFQQNNLHVVNYSVPVHEKLSLKKLKEHLFTLPEKPEWIPYRTAYYNPSWGFCMRHNALQALSEGDYEVRIDSTLEEGNLTYGECYLRGESTDEVLISAHSCHPSLANDNLSGVAVAAFLARALSERKLRYSYRFLFAPGTIGAIAWLARNKEAAARVRHGIVLTCIGDRGGFHYKKSRRGDAEIDRAAAHVLRNCGESSEVLEFSPSGYDERQYCSPGFNLPVGCLMRSVWGTFPEYHTSADNLEFIAPQSLAKSLKVCTAVVDLLENNRTYLNLNPYCEPQLGKRNLYRNVGGDSMDTQMSARLWVLNLSDGRYSLLDIAERSGLPFDSIHAAAELLRSSGVLEEAGDESSKSKTGTGEV
jgi:aminopeptidase-like protein